MTYDPKIILKYCGRSSHDLLVLCGWSWPLSEPVWGRSWSPCWRVLGPLLLCWRSWAALGPYVGGLGRLFGPMLAVLEPMLAVLTPLGA